MTRIVRATTYCLLIAGLALGLCTAGCSDESVVSEAEPPETRT